MSERWLPISGYEGSYEVSDQGRVRSLARTVVHRGGVRQDVPDRVLKATLGSTGYRGVALHRQGVQSTKRVAHLVAAAFIGPRPAGMFVCHNDDNPTNDAASNLRYDSPAGNTADCIRNRKFGLGERAPQSKLKIEDVLRIKGDLRPNPLIADEYGVTRSNVSAIKRGRSWVRAIAEHGSAT